MAQVITLSRRSSRTGKGNRKGSGRIKDVIKKGYFNVLEFANWVTGFKSDEVSHSSDMPVDIHRTKRITNKRYF